MASIPTDDTEETQPPEYTMQEIGTMLFNMKIQTAKNEKKMMNHKYEQESFTRQQSIINKNLEETLATISAHIMHAKGGATPRDPSPPRAPSRGWKIPPSLTSKPDTYDPETWPRLKSEPPRFNGENATDWIRKIQKFYNHTFMPLSDRLYLTSFLFDHPAADWMSYWEDNNSGKTWEEFLLAVKQRFDPDLYEDYVGRLATLSQTTTVEAYQTAFESMLPKVADVTDSTLTSLFIAGLKPALKQDLLTKRPSSLQETFALAQQISACHTALASQVFSSKPTWNSREPRPTNYNSGKTTNGTHLTVPSPKPLREGQPPGNLPVVRVSAAERAERTRKNLCWYCDENWSRTHVCSKRFYALMGDDENDEPPNQTDPHAPNDMMDDDDGENMVITGDVSSVHVISPQLKPRSIRLTGSIRETKVSVLIDGGSTHNFIKPAVAEKLSLPVHSVTPFRVFVGNGESLRCSHACLKTPIMLQSHHFDIDLFLLQVEGPDVILGVQWLQELGDVTKNYRKLTMKFEWGSQPVFLQGEGGNPRQISYNNLYSLIGQDPTAEVFEVVAIPQPESKDREVTEPVAECIQQIITSFQTVFEVPRVLPPSRRWDHRIHIPTTVKPINVRPYRYPYFQKAEIVRQIQDMIEQGVIQHSTSPFSSPVLLVRKKDGTFRFCVDYRALNAATTPDHFPIPTADELFDELHAATIFSKLDLRSGYHQIRMHEDDVYKTAFRTHDGHFEFLVMPFGLTNAPSTFQAAMNAIFQPYLRKFVIVFFDDILVYSRTIPDHADHLRLVFQTLADHSFFVKQSKCAFGVSTIEYLGHIISNGELRADPSKIEAMIAWPTPRSVKQLRGFLGLTGYYRRFVAQYSIIAAPLTDLLKKEAFQWSDTAQTSFEHLKAAMSSTPVLHLPNFDLPFVVETDASDFGIGAVLLQNGHPLAYFSKKLGPRRRLASTYHKELYAIVEAVQKWRQYLLGREFIIRSDQRSLKDLLSQIVQTPDQQFYIRKLMGFNFTIEYKSGASNKVADALSQRESDGQSEDQSLLTLFARPAPTVLSTIRQDNEDLDELRELHSAVAAGTGPNHVSVADGILYFKRRIYVGRASAARSTILDECHSAPSAGHPGIKRTFARVACSFYWLGLRDDVRDFVSACFVCQSTKYIRDKPNGLIQPLPIPDLVWQAASMDFIVGLPPSNGFTAIMVVVDRLSKYAHFGALKRGFDATKVARLFVDNVVKLHGFPEKLLSDRDPIFMSTFWDELLSLSGTKLQFTTAYHPQTDGQSEVTNRALEQYLRAFSFDRPERWYYLLPWAELALNCSFNVSIGMSPFQALYGREPPNLFTTLCRPSHNPAVADILMEREDLLRTLKARIAQSQHDMATYANRHRKDVQFQVGDKVLLRLQPYRQRSVGRPVSAKLGRRFYGPFSITERVGAVAYRLQLPVDSKIHDVFHVSLLRPFVAPLANSATAALPAQFRRGQPIEVPVRAVESRTVLVDGVPEEQWLVHWTSNKSSPPSWEPAETLKLHFPHLHLEDKAAVKEGGVDRDSTTLAPSDDETMPPLEDIQEQETDQGDPKMAQADEGEREQVDEERRKERPKRKVSKPARYRDYSSR